MTTFDDLPPGDDTQRDQRPAARHRDIPTSTPAGGIHFQRIWRTTWS